jgi:small conductance mechanosensitive channel
LHWRLYSLHYRVSRALGPIAGIEVFADSSINLGIRFWAKTHQRVETLYRANMAIHDALKQAGIAVPFPQREVRMLSAD